MNKEFVPYTESLELKELNFDEPCFGKFICFGKSTKSKFQYNALGDPKNYNNGSYGVNIISAPLYQQAFRWFREKCRLFSSIQELNIGYQHSYYFVVNDEDSIQFLKYEDAELACLDKLISILKEQQNETF